MYRGCQRLSFAESQRSGGPHIPSLGICGNSNSPLSHFTVTHVLPDTKRIPLTSPSEVEGELSSDELPAAQFPQSRIRLGGYALWFVVLCIHRPPLPSSPYSSGFPPPPLTSLLRRTYL